MFYTHMAFKDSVGRSEPTLVHITEIMALSERSENLNEVGSDNLNFIHI